jgi:hypothetical protein
MRRIIVLDKIPEQSGEMHFRFAMWADVPAARQARYANASFVSAVQDGSVTAAELQALQTGAVLERVEEQKWAAATPLATIEAGLLARFTTFQAEVNAANQWARYGSFYDDTTATWTLKNNA